ncbi:oxidoreductase [Mytilinidion resinicola]|uniref:Oxidoreductase n=1 Tax=Mytilinidion resinicola TaxID=574789 RepID=A0A6A6Y120_9PEZI|nr:oxidoreductase [Mytilinidion resinicola]KAF2802339.1 oxidoreductase [Mytilinidion resinicola]
MDFPGVALITGAASGIGRETALLYAREGCKALTIADLNAAGLEETKKKIEAINPDAKVRIAVCNVTDEAAVQSMVDGTVEQFGRLDYAANVAGMILLGVQTADMSTDFFEKHYQVNLRGLFFCERAELQAMLKQEPITSKDSKYPARGAIVNVSSMSGLVASPDIPAYAASKFGVIGLTKSDGMNYGKKLIRVNAVAPGAVATPILANSGNKASATPLKDSASMDNGLGRFGDPEELAQCIVWLTSGRASYVTASTVVANGGQLGG